MDDTKSKCPITAIHTAWAPIGGNPADLGIGPTIGPLAGGGALAPLVGAAQEWSVKSVLMSGFGLGFLQSWCCQLRLHDIRNQTSPVSINLYKKLKQEKACWKPGRSSLWKTVKDQTLHVDILGRKKQVHKNTTEKKALRKFGTSATYIFVIIIFRKNLLTGKTIEYPTDCKKIFQRKIKPNRVSR
jgi:hypothetical protein